MEGLLNFILNRILNRQMLLKMYMEVIVMRKKE